jgi:hypothetical protein
MRAERADVVCRMMWVIGVYEGFCILRIGCHFSLLWVDVFIEVRKFLEG